MKVNMQCTHMNVDVICISECVRGCEYVFFVTMNVCHVNVKTQVKIPFEKNAKVSEENLKICYVNAQSRVCKVSNRFCF